MSFGIISIVFSLVFCPILGLPFGLSAWIMGQSDLTRMQARHVEPSGRSLTEAGWVCGIIGTVLNALATLGCCGFGLIGIAQGG
ncbi:MAG: hypothetical protein NZ700_08595 [Gemmataceae bacterium]|nr:hypothetical protein [Gemmataceae bacterium]MDW8266345.1 hypothetical protein [Gemmataceae bacterium]